MAEGLTFFGSGAPVRNSDGALATTVADASAIGQELVGLGRWEQVGPYIYDNTISTVTTLTPPAGATAVVLNAAGQDVYVTLDNTAPSATNGLPLTTVMGPRLFPLQGSNPVKVIEAAASATVRGVWVK